MLTTLFAEKWTRLWNDFKLEYNQLDAYRVDETVTRDRDDSDESTNTFGKVIDSTHTDSGSVDTNTVTADTSDGSVYGFNSITNVPSDKNTTTGNENVIETNTFPNIKGIVIVAKGVENTMVKMNILKAVQAVIDISSGRIEILSSN